MKYQDFYLFKKEVEELLKKDKIEEGLNLIFKFIQHNHEYYEQKIPPSMFIPISAAITRLKKAFAANLIEWELVYEKRSELIIECLNLLDIIDRDAQEDIEQRNYPSISGPPLLYDLPIVLSKIEKLLSPSY